MPPASLPTSTLDRILTAQFVVAWAGESGEPRRLGWWRTDLVNEFGGEDLFRRLMPGSWAWAVLQAAREAARRTDAAGRAKDHDPDRLVSLFRLGHADDERLDERLQDLKQAGRPPTEALPGLRELLGADWSPTAFGAWVGAQGASEFAPSPAGRRLRGEPPESRELRVERLVGALSPLSPEYPLPHYRKGA